MAGGARESVRQRGTGRVRASLGCAWEQLEEVIAQSRYSHYYQVVARMNCSYVCRHSGHTMMTVEAVARCCSHCYRSQTKRLVLAPHRGLTRSWDGVWAHVRSAVKSRTDAPAIARIEWEAVNLCAGVSEVSPIPVMGSVRRR